MNSRDYEPIQPPKWGHFISLIRFEAMAKIMMRFNHPDGGCFCLCPDCVEAVYDLEDLE